jgi:Fe-S-cluster-containing dehydrogenase component
MIKQLGFLFNANLCIGCRGCEAACKNENKTAAGVRWRRVSPTSDNSFLSISCNHCDSPECFRICPQKAFSKRRDGIVMIDTDLCDGCMKCLPVCPFAAPQFDLKQRKASKCIFCHTRLKQDLLPACIEACPTEALQMVELNEEIPEGSVRTIPGFPDILLTKPSIRFYPSQAGLRYFIQE